MAFARLSDRTLAWELFGIINPVNHGKSATAIATYKVEPYVVAADVYALSPHTGRGGCTWYRGAAGWVHLLIVESLLGLWLEVYWLNFDPCLPAGWGGFKMHYRYRETVYHIAIVQGHGEAGITLDGEVREGAAIPLVDDRRDHTVEVRLGKG
jgi:cellobiose phosphorylase